MTGIAKPRQSRPNECATFETKGGETIVSIVKVGSAGFYVYVSKLRYDEEEDVRYWSELSQNLGGIYDSVSTAHREASHLLNEQLIKRDTSA
jgi:hypothetical protein